ncbi:response regulator [Candidatus Kuenenbacteria bacterium HGW-Kuenenbacteria-1]|uniref:Response regulator n=1 Tax=Candidatus Kuenenbacteria bacterium HGW-Kuenenbacteria-1 TaxID=2013812 RepID=A0A2N1UNI2_9BACT|nr:MAG: response regulator [Candidatus Kuenenbacteria bacterium HGW-Kuenenbacteria-1]
MTNKIKILIVEDDFFLRKLCQKKLEQKEFEVFLAEDGNKGIEEAKKNQPDLILLDIILPGINGFEVLKTLKKDLATASIPIVLLSNLGQKEDIDKGLALGANDYLIKAHFSPQEIVDKIEEVLMSIKSK